jgi:hypothetical protein
MRRVRVVKVDCKVAPVVRIGHARQFFFGYRGFIIASYKQRDKRKEEY